MIIANNPKHKLNQRLKQRWPDQAVVAASAAPSRGAGPCRPRSRPASVERPNREFATRQGAPLVAIETFEIMREITKD
jgi:hypothetical protein